MLQHPILPTFSSFQLKVGVLLPDFVMHNDKDIPNQKTRVVSILPVLSMTSNCYIELELQNGTLSIRHVLVVAGGHTNPRKTRLAKLITLKRMQMGKHACHIIDLIDFKWFQCHFQNIDSYSNFQRYFYRIGLLRQKYRNTFHSFPEDHGENIFRVQHTVV